MATPNDTPSERHSDTVPLAEPLDEFLDAKAKTVRDVAGDDNTPSDAAVDADDGADAGENTDTGTGTETAAKRRSGNYVASLARVVPAWIEWSQDRGVDTLDTLSPRHMARYAQYLSRRVDAHRADATTGITAATAHQYYAQVSAYLTYCHQWEYLDENPATTARAQSQLPDRPQRSSGSQQFWSPSQRATLIAHLDSVAADAVDTAPQSKKTMQALRDRALAYVIGYSGVRGAEVLAAPHDDRRAGLTWGDVDREAETLTVLGKSQQEEVAPLTDQPIPALNQWDRYLDPPTPDWPVFPSFHLPSLRDAAREQLTARDATVDTVTRVTELSTQSLLDAYRENRLTPPALTTAGGRSVLKRLTDAADVDCADGNKPYLTLHGARRGVGEAYYDNASIADAQRVLRHQDPATTSKMYSHKEASDLSDVGSEVFQSDTISDRDSPRNK